jgi:gamma-glutamyltranspeptidase/glutathione hydrolase
VALTTTLNAWFGSGVTVPGLGFVLNDEMDDFATVPGTANMLRPRAGRAERHRPRQAHALVDVADHRPRDSTGRVTWLVLGGAGGSRIITAVFEELSNALDFGMTRQRCRARPALPPAGLPRHPLPRAARLPDDVVSALHAMGHETKDVEHLADAPGIGKPQRAVGGGGGAAEGRGGWRRGPDASRVSYSFSPFASRLVARIELQRLVPVALRAAHIAQRLPLLGE